jgi:hypothetical protein
MDEVFAYIADAKSLREWHGGVIRSWCEPPGPVHEGTVVHLLTESPLPWRGTARRLMVTMYDPSRSMALTSSLGPYEFRTRYALERVGRGTRVRCEFESGAADRAARLLLPLVSRVMSRRLAASLKRLKARLGGEASAETVEGRA